VNSKLKLNGNWYTLISRLNKFPSDHGKKITKYAGAGRVQTIKFFSSQNHTEKLVLVILGRFPINKTQN
jgi:hypothetical protein